MAFTWQKTLKYCSYMSIRIVVVKVSSGVVSLHFYHRIYGSGDPRGDGESVKYYLLHIIMQSANWGLYEPHVKVK